MSSRSGWLLTGLVAIALGPAAAQVDPLAPLPAPPRQATPPPSTPRVQVPTQAIQQIAPTYSATTAFNAYKLRLADLARRAGVREATIQAHLPALQLNSRVIRLDRSQPTGAPNSNYIPPFAPYRRQHVSQNLISRGQARYHSQWARLQQVESRYGVDPAVIMAIYGHETSFGSVTGNFDLLEALASLAYEGRRRDLFESEFVAALRLIDSGTPRWRLKGSWAGATGYPQFMPSTVLRLRADGDGDGYADIWASEADGFASIANYLRDVGWKRGVPWGVAVRVPAGLDRSRLRTMLQAPRCPAVYRRHSRWQTMREWRAMGVQPLGRALPEDELATLIEPDGPNATAYLLSGNYRTILDYNCSNFYALSVGLLADAIARR